MTGFRALLLTVTDRGGVRLAATLRLIGVGAVITTLGGSCNPAMGQAAAQRDSSARADLADRLRGQGRARVRLQDGREAELLDPSLDGDSLRFTAVTAHGRADTLLGEGVRSIAMATVMRVQVRRTSAGKGAILGLIVGGTALAIRDRTGNPPTWDHNETLFFGMIGGVLGSVIGGVIGAPFRGWTTVYQAPPPACGLLHAGPTAGAQQRSYVKVLRARAARCMLLRPLG